MTSKNMERPGHELMRRYREGWRKTLRAELLSLASIENYPRYSTSVDKGVDWGLENMA
jgi:hypothetical protein